MDLIKFTSVISEMDEKLLPDGSKKTFSVKFIKSDGEVVFFNRAINTGLNRINLKDQAMRGIMPVDKDGEKLDHIYPVKIWNIIEFNGKQVTLR